eukprot:3583456-Rhodomonas_salina.2
MVLQHYYLVRLRQYTVRPHQYQTEHPRPTSSAKPSESVAAYAMPVLHILYAYRVHVWELRPGGAHDRVRIACMQAKSNQKNAFSVQFVPDKRAFVFDLARKA